MAIAASCGSLNALTLGLPTRAAVPDAKGALPKQMFIGRGAVSAKTKQRFATDIESISMLAILRPATTGLAESRRFPEILVLGLHVPSGAAVPVEVIDHIAAQRQGGIVFVCVRDGGPLPDAETGEPIASDAEQCAFAVRRNVPVKPGHTPITKVRAGAWRPAAGTRLTVHGATMEELWDSLCAQTIADDIDGTDIDARIAARERATFLESEYSKAKAAHARARTTEQRNAAYGKMLAIRKELAQLKVWTARGGRAWAACGVGSAADECDPLDVVAVRGAVDHEAVADHLHEFGTQTFGQLLAGLLGGQAGAVEHIAFDELALLDRLIGLLDGRIGQVVLADLDDRVEMMGHRLELLDLLLRQRHDRMCLPAVVVRTRVRPADHGRCRIVQVCKRPSTVREGAENPGDNPAAVR